MKSTFTIHMSAIALCTAGALAGCHRNNQPDPATPVTQPAPATDFSTSPQPPPSTTPPPLQPTTDPVVPTDPNPSPAPDQPPPAPPSSGDTKPMPKPTP